MRTYQPDVTNNADILDSRDVVARIRELEDEREGLEDTVAERKDELANLEGANDSLADQGEYGNDESNEEAEARDRLAEAETALKEWDDSDEAQELKDLQALEAEAEGYSDWRHGATLIRDSYFEDFARQEAEELHNVRDASWPFSCIDWEKAADELKQDYTSVDFDGVTYWVRS